MFEKIAEKLAEHLGCDPEEITRNSTFKGLGIDSVDTVELLMDLEEEIGVELELEEKIETVGELADFVENAIS